MWSCKAWMQQPERCGYHFVEEDADVFNHNEVRVDEPKGYNHKTDKWHVLKIQFIK